MSKSINLFLKIIILLLIIVIAIFGLIKFDIIKLNNNGSYNNSVIEEKSRAADGDYIYYKNLSKIYKVDKNTKKKELVADTGITEEGFVNRACTVKDGLICCVYNKYVGTDNWWPYIYRVKIDGSDGKLISKGYNPIIYDNSIYYIKVSFDENASYFDEDMSYFWENVGIYKMSLDGTGDTCIIEGSIDYLTIKDSKLYFNDSTAMYTANLDGSNMESITSSPYEMKDLYLYYDYGLDSDIGDVLDDYYIHSTYIDTNIFDVSDGYIYYSVQEDYTSQKGDNFNYAYYESYLYKMNIETKEKIYLAKIDGILRHIVVVDDCMLVDYYKGYNDTEGNMYENNNSQILLFDTDGKNKVSLEEYMYFES